MFSTTSASIFSSARYSSKTASCQATSRRSMSNSGSSRKSPVGSPRAAGDQHMQVWMPVQEFAVRLNGGDHAGHHIVATQQTANFCPDAGPGTASQFSQQPAIKPRVHSQTFGDGQHDLPMGDWRADFLRRRAARSVTSASGGTRDRCSAACRRKRRTSRAYSRDSELARSLPADRRT